ncbi:MAG: hydrogenase maturation protease [Anaerolineae bacterium]|nr:hydrogenase maturation protease [Anaerolineae bacterium]
MQKPQILVVGLGNPILGDDGVGWRVADEVSRQLMSSDVEIDSLALGGLSLMERLVGYDEVIIVDAIQTQGGQIGEVYRYDLSELPDSGTRHTTAVHDMSLQTALILGKQMGVSLPARIQIVAVEAARVYDFSEEMTAAVETAVPRAAQVVMKMLLEIEAACRKSV